jgi:hypothetical protein
MNRGDKAIILSGEDKGEVVTIECSLSGIGLCDSVVAYKVRFDDGVWDVYKPDELQEIAHDSQGR